MRQIGSSAPIRLPQLPGLCVPRETQAPHPVFRNQDSRLLVAADSISVAIEAFLNSKKHEKKVLTLSNSLDSEVLQEFLDSLTSKPDTNISSARIIKNPLTGKNADAAIFCVEVKGEESLLAVKFYPDQFFYARQFFTKLVNEPKSHPYLSANHAIPKQVLCKSFMIEGTSGAQAMVFSAYQFCQGEPLTLKLQQLKAEAKGDELQRLAAPYIMAMSRLLEFAVAPNIYMLPSPGNFLVRTDLEGEPTITLTDLNAVLSDGDFKELPRLPYLHKTMFIDILQDDLK